MMARLSEAEFFGKYLEWKAPQYFEHFPPGAVEVICVEESIRAASSLYRFKVRGDGRVETVLVKVPSSRQEQEARIGQAYELAMDRPRIAPDVAGSRKYMLEYRAMTSIQAHFSALENARFGVIRIFELVEEKQAIIMAFSSDPRLRDLVAKNSSLRAPFDGRGRRDLSRVFEHAGAWLRAYHTMETVPEQAEVGHQRREDYLDSIVSFTQFLGEKCDDVSFFTAVKEQTQQVARAVLPPVLPLGPAHGDFALRNILVGEGERVTVIDTLARLCVPIYEDLAYFLVGLKGNRLQVFSQGLAFRKYLLARYEQAFLAGYFAGQTVPRTSLRLFEIQALLDKWSSLFVLIHSGRRGAVKGVQLKLTNLYYRRLMKTLLRALSEGE